jgi:hypothetical protein
VSSKEIDEFLKRSGFKRALDNVDGATRAINTMLKGMTSNSCKFCGQTMNTNSSFCDKCGKAQE